MFNSKGKATGSSVADGKSVPVVLRPSVLAEGIAITGDIQGDGELLIEGRLEGSVRCKALTIGETGSVKGRIVADTVLVKGEIEGEVEAEQVTLAKTARVIGDVRHSVLAVDAGAVVEGRYSRLEETSARAVVPPRQETKAPSIKGQPPVRGKGGQDGDPIAVEVNSAAIPGEIETPANPGKPLH